MSDAVLRERKVCGDVAAPPESSLGGNRKKVLFVSRAYLDASPDGGREYRQSVLRYLHGQGHDITYVTLPMSFTGGSFMQRLRHGRLLYRPSEEIRGVAQLYVRGFHSLGTLWVCPTVLGIAAILVRCFEVVCPRITARVGKMVMGRRNPAPSESRPLAWESLLVRPAEHAYVRKLVARVAPGVVIAECAYLGGLFDAWPCGARAVKVLLTYDVFHLRLASFEKARLSPDYIGITRDAEAAELRKADVLVAIQSEEATTLREMAPHCRVVHVPMACCIKENLGPQVSGRCLFIGSGATYNRSSLQWFVRGVWPRVQAAAPHATLNVCGGVCAFFDTDDPSVRVRGVVPDLADEYGEAEVCLVAPLAGSGLKVKLIEALSHGRAAVSTSVGVQGVEDMVRQAVLVADEAQQFAAAIVTLLSDHRERHAREQAAVRCIQEHFSPERAYGVLKDL